MTYILLLLSVLLGAFLVIFIKLPKKIVRLLLAFSGSYLLSITILHLMPEVFTGDNDSKTIGLLILIGIVLQSVLESFSKGAEHGHIHIHGNENKFPLLLFISLCIHAFSEGLPIEHANDNLLWAIIVHKIPIAIVLTTYLMHSNFAKKTIFIYILVFGLMSPLGVLVADKIDFFSIYNREITAIIIGVFLHISTIILFEGSENHSFNIKKFLAIILGIVLTILTV
ncbi:ZIP family metal transporter [Polaribacter gangjinensis]|uniref:ZIP family metal transporter n=1 Tax=Polaribacter gangjinensis TaxID=574710 RepID=A0A2S7WA89_9FLAO|nr:ZIP family metal transporter [Polaribacter gangjinensis]PQJ74550.1 ZIP family metal transporter [Polaribacter gangjinensis]